jgi:hypothetical protein
MRYVNISVSTAFFAPKFISHSNGGVLGDGGNTALPADPFLLTKPDGTNYDLISTSSELYQAISDFYSQPNTNNLWVQHLPSAGAAVVDEVMLPVTGGSGLSFQITATNLVSLSRIREMVSGVITLVDPSEYTANLTTGIVTFDTAKTNDVYADYNVDAFGYGLKKLRSKDVQVLFKANETNITNIQRVIDEAELATSTQRFRTAVGMMPSGQVLTGDWLSNLRYLRSVRHILASHKCDESDAAACLAGVICGHEPNDSLTLENIVCDQDPSDPFSDDEEYSFWQNQVLAFVPNEWVGTGVTCLHSFNMSGSATNKWIDTIRTSDYLALLLISRLTNPKIIGGIGYNKNGMGELRAQIESALTPALNKNYIDSIDQIVNPLEVIILKEPSARSPAERAYLLTRKSQRVIDEMIVLYTYPASPDQIYLDLRSQ